MKKPPAPKLSPREKRHAKKVKLLMRWHKKVKQAIDTLAKSKTVIPKLERELERYDRGMLVNAPLVKAEPLPEAAAPQVTNKGKHEEGLDIPEFLRRDNIEPKSAVAALHKVIDAKAEREKPKRKRKPPGDDLAALIG